MVWVITTALCLAAVTVTFVSLPPSSPSGGRSLLAAEDADWGGDEEGWGQDEQWGSDNGDDDWGQWDDQQPIKQGSIDQAKPADKGYELLNREMLHAKMEKDVSNASEILSLPAAVTEQLLRHHKWNPQRALDAWLLTREAALKPAGIVREQQPLVPLEDGMDDNTFECPMCYDDKPQKEFGHAKCGHQICHGCWRDHCQDKVKGKDCVKLTCAHGHCNCRVAREQLREYLTPENKERYERFILDDYAETLPLVSCPTPDCQIACLPREKGMVKEVLCSGVPGACGKHFCTGCPNAGHRPAPCEVAAAWHAKFGSEAENVKYIMANTKRCPKCRCPIEKNQGCNHMTCKSCRHEFCWLCKGDWKSHGTATGGFYKCNIYQANQKAGKKTAEEEASANAKNDL